ncbi:MFS multidrug transporter [Xylogone sp. PMI_703]|nr:MFS multidrug transporter [Xylogone sp. PMI_703]
MSETEVGSMNDPDVEKLDRGFSRSDAEDDELNGTRSGPASPNLAARQHLKRETEKKEDEDEEEDRDRNNNLTDSDDEENPEGPTSLQPHTTSSSLHSTASSARRRASAAPSILTTTISHLRSRAPNANAEFTHPLAHVPTGRDVIVNFDGKDDPYNPTNWPSRKKVVTTLLYGLTTCWVTFASAIYSTGVRQIQEEFHVKEVTAIAGISMVVFGFGLGPLVWAPLSEVYGRKSAVLGPYFLSAVFSFATATAKDIQTVLITRFFTGFFGAAPMTITGGVLADIFPPQRRGLAVVGYAIAVVGGPTLGPVVGGAITQSYLGWRWTEYITGIVMMAQLVLDVVLLDESYPPILLVYKARRLRIESGNWALHAKHEEWDVSIKELAQKYLIRPFQMLCTPICFLISLYAAFVYGILYANLGGFTIVFQENRGWGQVTGNLPFIAMLIGILCAASVNVLNNKFYFKKFTQNNNRPIPEARLPPMMLGGFIFTGGLFLYGWTSSPHISAWPSIIGIGMIGFGFTTIFQSALNYIVDTFTRYSASAIAANTFLRSVFAGAFPLFITPMYRNIGVDIGSTIFGGVAIGLIPVPFLFYIWGKRIRARGVWSRPSVA